MNVIDSGIRKTLNSHGHAFQHALLGRVAALLSSGESPWTLEASEFPVASPPKGTRVDFILRRTRGSGLMVAECKRALNTTWAFARAPFVTKLNSYRLLTLEQVTARQEVRISQPIQVGPIDAYDVCLPLKTASVSTSQAQNECSCGAGGKNDPEDAFSQLMRGVNGVTRFLGSRQYLMHHLESMPLVPVLFTSAQLRVTDVDLRTASLSDGNLDAATFPESQPADWVWYQFPQSHELRHDLRTTRTPGDIATSLLLDHIRTIAVVTPAGLKEFLDMADIALTA
jgi:hypothetical protein